MYIPCPCPCRGRLSKNKTPAKKKKRLRRGQGEQRRKSPLSSPLSPSYSLTPTLSPNPTRRAPALAGEVDGARRRRGGRGVVVLVERVVRGRGLGLVAGVERVGEAEGDVLAEGGVGQEGGEAAARDGEGDGGRGWRLGRHGFAVPGGCGWKNLYFGGVYVFCTFFGLGFYLVLRDRCWEAEGVVFRERSRRSRLTAGRGFINMLLLAGGRGVRDLEEAAG